MTQGNFDINCSDLLLNVWTLMVMKLGQNMRELRQRRSGFYPYMNVYLDGFILTGLAVTCTVNNPSRAAVLYLSAVCQSS